MNKEPNMKIDPNRLYMIDNGEVACGEHVGNTATLTGVCRDGEPLITVAQCTEGDADFAALMADAGCESCGKKESK